MEPPRNASSLKISDLTWKTVVKDRTRGHRGQMIKEFFPESRTRGSGWATLEVYTTAPEKNRQHFCLARFDNHYGPVPMTCFSFFSLPVFLFLLHHFILCYVEAESLCFSLRVAGPSRATSEIMERNLYHPEILTWRLDGIWGSLPWGCTL